MKKKTTTLYVQDIEKTLACFERLEFKINKENSFDDDENMTVKLLDSDLHDIAA